MSLVSERQLALAVSASDECLFHDWFRPASTKSTTALSSMMFVMEAKIQRRDMEASQESDQGIQGAHTYNGHSCGKAGICRSALCIPPGNNPAIVAGHAVELSLNMYAVVLENRDACRMTAVTGLPSSLVAEEFSSGTRCKRRSILASVRSIAVRRGVYAAAGKEMQTNGPLGRVLGIEECEDRKERGKILKFNAYSL